MRILACTKVPEVKVSSDLHDNSKSIMSVSYTHLTLPTIYSV